MSYDLNFLVPAGASVPTAEDFLNYFQARPIYSVRGDQIIYENANTEVYFYFEVLRDLPPVEADGFRPVPLAFNMNFFRPHFFGSEAELILSHFVRDFSLLVDDPQQGGMGRGEYSQEGFLRGWNGGNLFAHQHIAGEIQKSKPSFTVDISDALPRETLERIWHWNLVRPVL